MWSLLHCILLDDRTNGRAYAAVLRLSSVCEVVYEKSIGTKMNDLDL